MIITFVHSSFGGQPTGSDSQTIQLRPCLKQVDAYDSGSRRIKLISGKAGIIYQHDEVLVEITSMVKIYLDSQRESPFSWSTLESG